MCGAADTEGRAGAADSWSRAVIFGGWLICGTKPIPGKYEPAGGRLFNPNGSFGSWGIIVCATDDGPGATTDEGAEVLTGAE